MQIVFVVDLGAFEGLGGTITSLLKSCSDPSKLRIAFLCSGISVTDKENINQLFEFLKFEGEFSFSDFDAAAEFGHLASLHGSWTNYGRLLIPGIFQNTDHVLYLDADLLIFTDVLALCGQQFSGQTLPLSQD